MALFCRVFSKESNIPRKNLSSVYFLSLVLVIRVLTLKNFWLVLSLSVWCVKMQQERWDWAKANPVWRAGDGLWLRALTGCCSFPREAMEKHHLWQRSAQLDKTFEKIFEGWMFSSRVWGLSDLTGTWAGSQRQPCASTPWAAQVVLRASHPLCHNCSLFHNCLGFACECCRSRSSVCNPKFPELPQLSVSMGRQRICMGLLPWGGKGGYPHAMQEIWDILSWDGFQSLRQGPDKLLLLFFLPLSLLTLGLDRQSLFILSCEHFFLKQRITARLAF